MTLDPATRDLLTTAEYREALVLVLAELRDLPGDPLDKAQRLGRLESYLATITGQRQPGMEPIYMEPIYGLRALRRDQSERTAPPSEEGEQ